MLPNAQCTVEGQKAENSCLSSFPMSMFVYVMATLPQVLTEYWQHVEGNPAANIFYTYCKVQLFAIV